MVAFPTSFWECELGSETLGPVYYQSSFNCIVKLPQLAIGLVSFNEQVAKVYLVLVTSQENNDIILGQ
jgi:hypothetical protein